MTNEKETADQYRFSGFEFFKIQLDSTGPSYIVRTPHPYYYNQPAYWSSPYFQMASGPNAVENNASKMKASQVYPMSKAF